MDNFTFYIVEIHNCVCAINIWNALVTSTLHSIAILIRGGNEGSTMLHKSNYTYKQIVQPLASVAMYSYMYNIIAAIATVPVYMKNSYI